MKVLTEAKSILEIEQKKIKMKSLTWIPVVEIILNVTRYVVSFSVLYPMWICLYIISNKNSKQDDHG